MLVRESHANKIDTLSCTFFLPCYSDINKFEKLIKNILYLYKNYIFIEYIYYTIVNISFFIYLIFSINNLIIFENKLLILKYCYRANVYLFSEIV